MARTLFAGIAVTDHDVAVAWYERLFGCPASFRATETESVWKLEETAWIYVVRQPEHAGHGLLTILVEDLDAVFADIADRGIVPVEIEVYGEEGMRKAIFRDPDGNEFGYGGQVSRG